MVPLEVHDVADEAACLVFGSRLACWSFKKSAIGCLRPDMGCYLGVADSEGLCCQLAG